jgi:prevent-host-death family protein
MPERSIGDTRAQLADLLSRAFYQGERTVITRRGRPIAALIPIQDLQLLQMLEDTVDRDEAAAAEAEGDAEGWVPLRQIIAERQRAQ